MRVVTMSTAYKNPGRLEFEAVIERGDGGGAFVEFPYDVEWFFGVKGRVPVAATFDGVPYSGSLVKMGPGPHLLLVLREIRNRLRLEPGDTVHVTVRLDETERKVDLPEDVAMAFQENPDAKTLYDRLAYTHQREHVRYIDQAKQPETRARRIAKVFELLRVKQKVK